ncbi:DUF4781 domain-containing protein, partial [Pyxidicoccus sp. 3LG]
LVRMVVADDASPLGQARAVLANPDADLAALTTAQGNLRAAYPAGSAVPPAVEQTLQELSTRADRAAQHAYVDNLLSTAMAGTDGWDHTTRRSLQQEANQLHARIDAGESLWTMEIPSNLRANTQPVPTAEDLERAAALERVSRDTTTAEQTWATLVPDPRTVVLDPAHPEQWTTQLQEAMRASVGPGDPAALERFFSANASSFDMLGNVLAGGPPPSVDTLLSGGEAVNTYQSALYGPALRGLAAQYPDASFRMLALEEGALPELGTAPAMDNVLVVEMTRGDEVTRLFLNAAVMDLSMNGDVMLETLAETPGLVDSWYRSARDAGTFPPGVDQGSAQATFDLVAENAGNSLVLDGILRMPASEQDRFFAAMNERQPLLGEDGLGLWTDADRLGVELAPDQVIAAVDANPLARGTSPAGGASVQVTVGGVEGLDKTRNFFDQHYDVLTRPIFTQFLELRGDTPRPLAGVDLLNEVGAAMNLAPNNIPQTDEDWARFQSGEWPLYSGEALAAIQPAVDAIRSQGGEPAQVTVLPIVYDSPETGPVQLPLFRVEVGDREVFVDNQGGYYDGFESWRTDNDLPPGRMRYPEGGHLTAGADGAPVLQSGNTPDTSDTPGEHVADFVDKAALVGGFVIGGAMVLGSGGTLLAVGGAATMAWGAFRSGSELVDRAEHGRSINPFTDTEARSAWLDFGASTLGLLAMGGSGVARSLAAGGSRFAGQAVTLASYLNVGSQALDTASTVNMGLELAANWDSLPPEQRLLMVSQLVFWAGDVTRQAGDAGGLQNLYSPSAVREHLLDGTPFEGPVEDGVALPAWPDIRMFGSGSLGLTNGTSEDMRIVRRGDPGWQQLADIVEGYEPSEDLVIRDMTRRYPYLEQIEVRPGTAQGFNTLDKVPPGTMNVGDLFWVTRPDPSKVNVMRMMTDPADWTGDYSIQMGHEYGHAVDLMQHLEATLTASGQADVYQRLVTEGLTTDADKYRVLSIVLGYIPNMGDAKGMLPLEQGAWNAASSSAVLVHGESLYAQVYGVSYGTYSAAAGDGE